MNLVPLLWALSILPNALTFSAFHAAPLSAPNKSAIQPRAASDGAMISPRETGWHDELNPESLRRWKWNSPLGHADLSIPKRGAIRLTLGERAQDDSYNGTTYYWAGAQRCAENDLDRFPILAVCVIGVAGKATWWDVKIREYRSGENYGQEWTMTLPGERGANTPGTLLFDVPAGINLHGDRRMRVQLNVAGLARGGTADYAWVRFVTRGKAERLAKQLGAQWVRARP